MAFSRPGTQKNGFSGRVITMFFYKKDRDMLQNVNDTLIRIDSDQRWIKENIPDKVHCTKVVWKQRAMNVILLIMILGVATYTEQVKAVCKTMLKLVGM